MTMLILMVLVALGIGRLVNPLLLFAFVTICFIALGVLEWREDEGESLAASDTTQKSAEPDEPEGGP
jgi:hypothetical protein